MTKLTVCTGFSPNGYEEYGKNFLEGFNQYWPQEIDLMVYVEEAIPLIRGNWKLLWDCPGSADFYWRHKEIPEHCGQSPTKEWKRKDYNEGYSWRWDATKFFKQCMIPENAVEGLSDGDIFIWLDGDVVTFANPTPEFFDTIYNDEFDLLHLGRMGSHTELGFWAIRINDIIRRFVFRLAEIYRSEEIFEFKQWHSAYAFDLVRKEKEFDGMKTVNWVPGRANGHVWFLTPLGDFCDHLKGSRRKKMGFSTERFEKRK